jgi:hypothetical protein
MRNVLYQKIPGGSRERTTAISGTLAQLVFDIPYLLAFRLLPPRDVLNRVLRTGLRDAGQSAGCRWEPLELDTAEYLELASVLAPTIESPTPPTWVVDWPSFFAWALELRNEVPHSKTLPLLREQQDLLDQLASSKHVGDASDTPRSSPRLASIAQELTDLIRPAEPI